MAINQFIANVAKAQRLLVKLNEITSERFQIVRDCNTFHIAMVENNGNIDSFFQTNDVAHLARSLETWVSL